MTTRTPRDGLRASQTGGRRAFAIGGGAAMLALSACKERRPPAPAKPLDAAQSATEALASSLRGRTLVLRFKTRGASFEAAAKEALGATLLVALPPNGRGMVCRSLAKVPDVTTTLAGHEGGVHLFEATVPLAGFLPAGAIDGSSTRPFASTSRESTSCDDRTFTRTRPPPVTSPRPDR